MSGRIILVFTLLLSLLFAPQAQSSPPPPTAMPGCAMTTCILGCCTNMPCCGRSAKDNPQPKPARTSPRAGAAFVARIEPPAVTILYLLPAMERRVVIREEVQAPHTLPRLAATCIQLI